MPITKGAEKKIKGDAKKRIFNIRRAIVMKNAIKELKKWSLTKNKKEAETLLKTTYKAIDKAQKRGIIKKNTASRKKAQMARIVKNIS